MDKETYAKTLFEAYNSGLQLPQSTFPEGIESLEDAYKVQHAFTAEKVKNGETLAGYKISMTSKGTQELFGASEPLYGQMTASRIAREVKFEDTTDALIELELMFIAKEELLPTDTDEELLAKVRVAPGLEMPDSRYENWFPKMTKEHLCLDGAVGGWVAIGESQVATYDSLDKIKGSLLFNGKEVSSNTSDIVLDHPLNAVRWLVKKLDGHGLRVAPNMFISSGTFVYPEKLEKGVYTGAFENFGSVTFTVE